MFLFILTLMAIRAAPVKPNEAGDTHAISPDIETETARNYATAYYWDMYGAMIATYNDHIQRRR